MKRFLIKSIKIQHVVIITFLISIAILFTTVAVYVIDGRLNTNGEINADALSAFGTFVGGLIGTLLAGVTLWVVFLTFESQKEELIATRELLDEQIKLSYRADLVIKNTFWSVLAYVNNSDGNLYPTITSHHDNSILIVNPGNGAAKQLQYTWILDMVAIDNFLKTYSTLSYHIKEDKIIFYDKYINKQFEIKHLTGRIELLLPYNTGSEGHFINIPLAYLYCLVYGFKHWTEKNKSGTLSTQLPTEKFFDIFPKAKLKINYLNKIGTAESKTFKIEVHSDGIKTTQYDGMILAELVFGGTEIKELN
ncbi:hypothetical protein EOD41_10795 [Mucilaginibacter limnophilus]|uniref:Uncharacterized protein n=1 Tax=Mucilaginibacter limnophilus TaxID=1932778 RepID=A0A3S2UM52_9SPHI|nr:hypothetical protein [Mucilaginibacter limnophilus]RVU01093.1 hypothetical protein EOD41_10795 [Mucilaginibacter limnophilus]